MTGSRLISEDGMNFLPEVSLECKTLCRSLNNEPEIMNYQVQGTICSSQPG